MLGNTSDALFEQGPDKRIESPDFGQSRVIGYQPWTARVRQVKRPAGAEAQLTETLGRILLSGRGQDHPLVVAEEVGFEPTTGRNTPGNRLAGGRTRPTMRLLQALVTQSGDLAEGVGFEPTRR